MFEGPAENVPFEAGEVTNDAATDPSTTDHPRFPKNTSKGGSPSGTSNLCFNRGGPGHCTDLFVGGGSLLKICQIRLHLRGSVADHGIKGGITDFRSKRFSSSGEIDCVGHSFCAETCSN